MTNQSYSTRIGKLTFIHDFPNGYPVKETYEKLFNEMDFQRACQAYIWAIPIVSFAQWQYAEPPFFALPIPVARRWWLIW